MNKCIVCDKECKGECCSGKCRARKSRRTRTESSARSEAHGVILNPDFVASVTVKGMTQVVDTQMATTPEHPIPNFGQADCECKHCQQHRTVKGSKLILNHGPYKTAGELGEHEINRVSLPSDADYIGVGNAILQMQGRCGQPVDNSEQANAKLSSGVIGAAATGITMISATHGQSGG